MRAVPVLGAAICLLLPAPLAAQPAIHLDDPARVVIDNLPPGGTAVLFGVCREPLTWSERVVPYTSLLGDLDGDGEVSLLFDGEVPVKSVWAAVDLASGELVLASPRGFAHRELGFNARAALKRGRRGLLRLLERHGAALQLLVVRPGVGAWRAAVSDGGPTDEDREPDGRYRIDLAAALPVGEVGLPFRQLAAGDTIIGIDPDSLEVFAVRLAGPGGAL